MVGKAIPNTHCSSCGVVFPSKENPNAPTLHPPPKNPTHKSSGAHTHTEKCTKVPVCLAKRVVETQETQNLRISMRQSPLRARLRQVNQCLWT